MNLMSKCLMVYEFFVRCKFETESFTQLNPVISSLYKNLAVEEVGKDGDFESRKFMICSKLNVSSLLSLNLELECFPLPSPDPH